MFGPSLAGSLYETLGSARGFRAPFLLGAILVVCVLACAFIVIPRDGEDEVSP